MNGQKNSRPHQEVVLEPQWTEVLRPQLYSVYLLNDDYTPMVFLVEVLIRFFSMNNELATSTILIVHTTGRASCGQYTRDIAETKVMQVNEYARRHQHPLLCNMEEIKP